MLSFLSHRSCLSLRSLPRLPYRQLGLLLMSCLSAVLVFGSTATPAIAQPLIANLPPGDAITDGKALLRYALPIDNEPVRTMQRAIEDISEPLRSRRRLSAITSKLTKADRVLTRAESVLLPSIAPGREAEANETIDLIKQDIEALRMGVDTNDKEEIWIQRGIALDHIGALESLMVQGFPFEVPDEYANLPQLKGRATIAIETSRGPVKVVVDGYNAPVTAGNFVDLVERGFYDGLEFIRAEDYYIVQIGDPPGPEVGFIDPATDEYRAIPLEIMGQGDEVPTYGITLEDAGRYLDDPVLPFAAYGTLGMARPGSDPNGGSSQFFFFLFEPELTPAGLNLLDGRYSVFGYTVEGKETLGKLKPGDRIESAKVTEGLENLVQPTAA